MKKQVTFRFSIAPGMFMPVSDNRSQWGWKSVCLEYEGVGFSPREALEAMDKKVIKDFDPAAYDIFYSQDPT